MAGPIAHILCGLLVLQSGALKVTDEKAFMLGTCYPDIDYLGVITRDASHYNNVRWEDVVAASTDFQKGLLLHSLVDEVRIAQLEKPNEAVIPHLPLMRSQIMKFFEDGLLYPKIKSELSRVSTYFNEVIAEEKTVHHLPDAAIQQWHYFIQTYCSQQPSVVSTHALINQFPQLRARIPIGIPSLIGKIYVSIAFRSFKKKASLIAATHHFYDNCVSLITSNAHLVHRHIMVPA